MATIDCLSTETLQLIFSFCNSGCNKTISQVSRRWADAVHHLMMKQICLKVSDSQTNMIGKRILLDSDRQYVCLKVNWRAVDTDRALLKLKNLLDVCQERYPVLKVLFLSVPPNETLVKFFHKRRGWMSHLTELHLYFERFDRTEAMHKECEVLLPNLKRFWCKISTYDMFDQEDYESSYAFTLNVPELCLLTVETVGDMMCHDTPRRFQEPGMCCLFLPPLKLKTSSKLETLKISGFWELTQRHIDNSELFLNNLTVLETDFVPSDLIIQLWKKCPKLKELSIDLDDDVIYSEDLEDFLPAMSRNLEKLTLKNCSLLLDLQVVFPKLEYILFDPFWAETVVDLVAPQLVSLRALRTESSLLVVHHKEQIRTMEVTMGYWIMTENPAPPNVTELILHWPDRMVSEPRVVQDYLTYFPNLQRLTICGRDVLYSLDFPVIEELPAVPNLQFFHAERLTLRLSDFQKFTGLKTLLLTECIVKAQPNDGGELILPTLEYCRVGQVAIEGYEGDGFPIPMDGRQSPPIDLVCVSAKGRKIFNTRAGGVQQPAGNLPEQF